jgi:DNA polymerase delta subunit 1
LVADITRKHNFLIPDRKYIKDDEVSEKYEGATVLDPNIGLYLDIPVSVLDFASLYPSSMIAENISHDTFVDEKMVEEYIK